MNRQGPAPIVRMVGITRAFPGVVANDGIDWEVEKGTIHAVLGENGAGKTTLMNVLFGLLRPDAGEIFVRGKRVVIDSPRTAIALGIGLVHQHLMLIPSLTALENIVLSPAPYRDSIAATESSADRVARLAGQYGLTSSLATKVERLSPGAQLRVGMVKALRDGCEILVLDEPTAALASHETSELFQLLRDLARRGEAIVLITHKLKEVMEISDRVTVLRNGRVAGRLRTVQTEPRELARLMVGCETPSRLEKTPAPTREPILDVHELWVLNDQGHPSVQGVSLSIHRGEILGIAGVAGNGQTELAEAIAGLRRSIRGNVTLHGLDLTNASPRDFMERGGAYIPADRQRSALALDWTVAENLVLKRYHRPPFRRGLFLSRAAIRENAHRSIARHHLRPIDPDVPVKFLSGGNQQKVVLARELEDAARFLLVVQPTHGLDIRATDDVHRCLLERRGRGLGILLISTDLDEIFRLSDRIAVLYRGRLVGMRPAESSDAHSVGAMMMEGT
jgi:general nucleoside transport system ATP-binding protein